MLTRLFLLLPFLPPVCATEIPAGATLQIRLTKALSTATAKVKQPVDAVLIAPAIVDGNVAIPSGTRVTGQIKEVKVPAEANDQAVLAIDFQMLTNAASKQRVTLCAKIVDVDNARESLDESGRILGIVASKTGSGRLDQGIGKIAERFPGLGELLGTAKQSIVKEADPNIVFEPGVEMTLQLLKPLVWKGAALPYDIQPVRLERELFDLVNRQPKQTMAASPRRASDLTNLMFLGSQEALEHAFQEAGWSTAAQLSGSSKLETFRAIVEMRGYKEAPVSTLLLDDAPPDLVFQKQNNTFAQRHHLRIWRRPGRLNGKEVWVCAATHDIGIDFSQEHRTFIHRVDPHTDLERAKIVADLLFTGQVKALSLVERPDVPKDGENATGDPFVTDGRMAVIEF